MASHDRGPNPPSFFERLSITVKMLALGKGTAERLIEGLYFEVLYLRPALSEGNGDPLRQNPSPLRANVYRGEKREPICGKLILTPFEAPPSLFLSYYKKFIVEEFLGLFGT